MKATLQTRFAYVFRATPRSIASPRRAAGAHLVPGAQRTALEAGDPVASIPRSMSSRSIRCIYWPIVPSAPAPSREALEHIDAYMKKGGTVLFDTRDAIEAPPGPDGANRSPGMVALRNILTALDIPDLEPVPKDHVLTKTFYLLKDFPGRFATGPALGRGDADRERGRGRPIRPARAGDGVSSVVITSNDMAGAWAIRPDGQAMLPIVSGEARQREFAFRAGVNIVMYTLTGNYKADQVQSRRC
jgi:hypothetical protein